MLVGWLVVCGLAVMLAVPAAAGRAPGANTWLVLGAFTAEGTETGEVATAEPRVGLPTAGKTWQYFDDRLFSRNYDDYQDLFSYYRHRTAAPCPPQGGMAAYAHAYVHSARGQEVEVRGRPAVPAVAQRGGGVGGSITGGTGGSDGSGAAGCRLEPAALVGGEPGGGAVGLLPAADGREGQRAGGAYVVGGDRREAAGGDPGDGGHRQPAGGVAGVAVCRGTGDRRDAGGAPAASRPGGVGVGLPADGGRGEAALPVEAGRGEAAGRAAAGRGRLDRGDGGVDRPAGAVRRGRAGGGRRRRHGPAAGGAHHQGAAEPVVRAGAAGGAGAPAGDDGGQ